VESVIEGGREGRARGKVYHPTPSFISHPDDLRCLCSTSFLSRCSPWPMAPSASSATRLRVPQVLAASISTTTVFTSPTNLSAPSESNGSSNSSLIGPIVGGVLGGVLLAVVCVVGWHCWGKSIKRKEDKKKKEMVSALARFLHNHQSTL
jgi:hypothetical protein